MTDTFDILKEYADYLNVANLFTTAFRAIGWTLLSLFRGILDGMEVLLDSVYSLAEFPV